MFAVVSSEGTEAVSTWRKAMILAKRTAKRLGISVRITSALHEGKWLVLPGVKAALKPWHANPEIAEYRKRDAAAELAYLIICINAWEREDSRLAARKIAA